MSNFSEQYREIIVNSDEHHRPLCSAEEEILGITHAEVGAYLMELWGLPSPIIEALAFHHDPSIYGDNRFSPLTAVHVANALEHEKQDETNDESQPAIDYKYLSGLGMNNRISYWKEIRQCIENGAY